MNDDIAHVTQIEEMTSALSERTVSQALEAAGAHDVHTIGISARPHPGSKSEAEYDLAVIGSGGAAMAAAITGVESGSRVVMIERGTIGGTCVNIGCIPSKTLLRAGEFYHQAAHHPFEGIETSHGAVDLASLVRQKDDLVAGLRKEKYEDLIGEYGWDLMRGEARFVDNQTLEVSGAGGSRRIRAGAYIVATGAEPAVPPIPGLAEAGYLTSTSALELTELPESLFVIGAGYVALELGQLFSRLGTRVTLMQRGPRLLGEQEPEIGELMRDVLEAEGITIITCAHVERVEGGEGGRMVHVIAGGKPQVHEAAQVLVATGRTPNTTALNLEAAGVQTDRSGTIRVDEQVRTTNPRVWAAGDVISGPQFVYAAAYEGKLAAENALRGAGRKLDFTALPGVIFTHPQVAVVGLTEAQALAQGQQVKSTVLPLEAVPRARANHDARGLVKLVADSGSGRILGVHMVSENAGDVIYSGVLAVKFGLTIDDLAESFAPYLTMSEGLKLAAQSFRRDVHKLSCCAA